MVIAPDQVADFTDLPFPDIFALVVMDPPHVQREEMLGNITKRYGCLNGDRCGRRWCDGEWVPLEFCRDARKQSIQMAKRHWRAMPPMSANRYAIE